MDPISAVWYTESLAVPLFATRIAHVILLTMVNRPKKQILPLVWPKSTHNNLDRAVTYKLLSDATMSLF